jgi:outer membrane receptor for ferric coprogen and ferric-rhodotorulic acid
MERRNHYEDFSTSKTAVPSLAGRAGLRWQSEGDNTALVWTDLYLRGETSSKLQEPGSSAVVESRESWVTINLASGLEFGAHRQYQLSVNLLNLSNKQYIPSAENLYGIERSINLNFTLDI